MYLFYLVLVEDFPELVRKIEHKQHARLPAMKTMFTHCLVSCDVPTILAQYSTQSPRLASERIEDMTLLHDFIDLEIREGVS